MSARHRGALPPGLPHGDPEDCGPFCVWWYTQTVRDRVRKIDVDEKRWAYALRSACGTYWQTSSPKSGFSTRDAAIAAGTGATKP